MKPEPDISPHCGQCGINCQDCEMDCLRSIIIRLEAIIELAQRASLDHSCGLEGWDETCPECVLCRALIEHRKSNE